MIILKNSIRSLAAMLLVVFVSGCDSDSNENTLDIGSLEFTLVNAFTTDNLDYVISDQLPQAGSRLVFNLIPGSLFGNIRPEDLIIEPVDENFKADVSFDSSIFRGTAKPEALSVDAELEGYTIVPADTKFGRIGTFVVDEFDQYVPGSTGLHTAQHGGLIMAYFDRASVLNGSTVFNDGNINVFNIEIPNPGFYAIATVNRNGTTIENAVVNISNEVFFHIKN